MHASDWPIAGWSLLREFTQIDEAAFNRCARCPLCFSSGLDQKNSTEGRYTEAALDQKGWHGSNCIQMQSKT